jgi:hypothetical protein
LCTAAGEGPLPTILVREPREYLCAFYRPLVGDDFAALLTKVLTRVDEIDVPWQKLPSADSAVGMSLERLVSSASASLAELVSRVQVFESR